MDYVIDMQHIRPLIKEEVSRIAASAFTEDGTPLYDHIDIIDQDDATIYRHITDAVAQAVARLQDIATYEGRLVHFNVPDMDITKTPLVISEMDRYIAMNVVSGWCQDHYLSKMEEYALRSQAALKNVITYLKSRRTPNRRRP